MQNKSSHKIKLTYFNITARAEAARLSFALGNVQFEDERLEFNFEKFDKIKTQPRFKFGLIPIIDVDGTVFAQSGAVNRLAGQLSGTYPTCPIEAAWVEQAYNTAEEIHNCLYATIKIEPESEKLAAQKALIDGQLGKLLEDLEKVIKEKNGTYFAKDISIADLHFYAIMGCIKVGFFTPISFEILDKYPTLKKLYETIDSNPTVVEWNKNNN